MFIRLNQRLKAVLFSGMLLGAGAFSLSSAAVLNWQPLYEPGCGGFITALSVSPTDGKHVLIGGDMLSIGYSDDRGDSWQATSGLSAYEICSFTWYPATAGKVWAATLMGPYLSTDYGKTWASMRGGMPGVAGASYSVPIQKIIIDPNDAQHLLAFGGNRRHWGEGLGGALFAVWESKNGGSSWANISKIGSGAQPNVNNAGFAGTSSSIVFAAVDADGVYKSTDGGKNWTKCPGQPDQFPMNLCTHPTNQNVAWASFSSKGVYKTTDGGNTWVQGLGFVGMRGNFKGFAVCQGSPDNLLTTDEGSFFTFRSTDGGINWVQETPARAVKYAYAAGTKWWEIAFDPKDPNVAFAGQTETAIRTTDGGKTWSDATSKLISPNFWRGRGYSGLVTVGFRFHPTNISIAQFTAMDHGNLWQTFDHFESWRWGGYGIPQWGDATGSRVSWGTDDGTIAYIAGPANGGRIAKSTDRGVTWKALTTTGVPMGGASDVYCVPGHAEKVWAILSDRLWASADSGNTWMQPFDHNVKAKELVGMPGQPSTFFVVEDNAIYRTDNGTTFTDIGGSCPAGIHRVNVSVDKANGNKVYLFGTVAQGGDNGQAYKWVDGNWSSVIGDGMLAMIAADPTDPRRLAICHYDAPFHDNLWSWKGVQISSDGGQSWNSENTGLGMLRGSVVAINPNDPRMLVYGSTGGGFWRADWDNGKPPVVVGVSHRTAPIGSKAGGAFIRNNVLSLNPAMGEQVVVSIQSLNGRILRSFAVKGTGAMQEFKLGNLRVNAGGTYIVTVKSSAHAGSSAMLLRKVID